MEKRGWILAGLLLAHGAWAADACTVGSEFEPPLCPLVLPAIKMIVIEENAAKSPASTDARVSCKAFRVTPKVVRNYLARAKSTNAHDAHYTLDWSPCHAAGSVVFGDGRVGEWRVEQFRSGSLKVDGGEATVLYCPTCTFKPFL